MKITKFSEYLQKLENTTKRLEITAILKEMINDLNPEETDIGVYLSLGYLKAPYENPKFNIADKMMLRVLENTYPQLDKTDIRKIYEKTGDLGDTIYEISHQTQSELGLTDVYNKLLNIAQITGSGSQEAKISKLTTLITELDRLSAKFITRIVLGTTRLGFTELTVIDALNNLTEGNKATKADIEIRYNTHPDIGFIAKTIKKHGLNGINKVGLEVGVPFLPQRCQRLADVNEIIDKMGTVYAEYKFDGTRVQLHMDRNKESLSKSSDQNTLFESNSEKKPYIRTFTRNLEETTHQYPDIVQAAEDQIDAQSVILDGEAIGYDRKTGEFLPFQEIMQRKRKHNVEDMAKEIPLKYFVFDILYLNGQSLINEPLEKRREILKDVIKKGSALEVDNILQTDSPDELAQLFEESKEKGLEGLVIKKVDAPYQAGARAYTWVKLKKADTRLLSDTVDVVILGYYFGKGVRASFGIGGFLAGIYDKKTDSFKTITKVGTGLKDEDFIRLKMEADKIRVDTKPANVEINSIFEPDVWVSPKIVVELGADEVSKSPTHTAGYALRFPRLIRFREDKSAEDTTGLSEIEDIHRLQKRGRY